MIISEEYEKKLNLDAYRDSQEYTNNRLKKRNTDKEIMEDGKSGFNECTFAPSITNKSRAICSKAGHKPIENRYKQEIKSKNESIDKLKKSVIEERKMKRQREEIEAIPLKLRTKKNIAKIQASRTSSRSGSREKSVQGVPISELDTYSKNMIWYEKKKLKINELQRQKQLKKLNETLEQQSRPGVGANIKPSVV